MLSEIMINALDDGVIHRVSPAIFKNSILNHFLKLEPEARRLRFGYQITDAGIDTYVNRMIANQNAENLVFVAFDDGLNIKALAHLALISDGTGELGISVLPEMRGKKLGLKLFKRIVLTAKVLGIKEIFVQCLSENSAMQSIARKMEMQVKTECGESEGRLKVQPITPSDVLQHALTHQITIYDFAIKAQMSHLKNIEKMLRGE